MTVSTKSILTIENLEARASNMRKDALHMRSGRWPINRKFPNQITKEYINGYCDAMNWEADSLEGICKQLMSLQKEQKD